MKKVLQILAALATSSSVLTWAVQVAYIQRGYQAYGSEYLLAGLVAVVVYWVTGKL